MKTPNKKILEKYKDLFYKSLAKFDKEINALEIQMAKETGVKDIEFIFIDGGCAGIGNMSRTMKLWQF